MADSEEIALPVDEAGAVVGDPIEILYRSHYDAMVRLAAVLLDDDHAAEEATQEAFISVDRHLDRIDQSMHPAYLRRAVVNACRSRHRAAGRAKRQPMGQRDVVDGPEDRALLDSRQREVIEAIRSLPARQRECIVLRYYAELSDTEIADALHLAPGSVKTHLRRARQALALTLEEAP